MTIQDRLSLSRPQWRIYEAGWKGPTRFRVAVCGRRFGKSFLMAEEIRRAVRLAVQHRVGTENEIWYGAPTLVQAKRVMWERLKATIPRAWLRASPYETDCSLVIRSGHRVRLVGLDRHDGLRGAGLWFFGGDEWADCRPDAWPQTIRPMLSAVCGHGLFIGTPKGFDHLYEAYELGRLGRQPNYRSFLYTTLDGGNVPPTEVESARALLDPRTFRQEYEASFETYSGRVVYAFSRSGSVKTCSYDSSRPVHVGLDFNINPMSATVWQDKDGAIEQVDEIVLPTSNTDEMCREIKNRFGASRTTGAIPKIVIYPDPAGNQRRTSAAGRTDIGILREHGFDVVALPHHPAVRERMNVMNAFFETATGSRSAFVDHRCVHSISAYERLVYRDGTTEPDKTGGHDHLVDATGYFMFARQGSGSATARSASFSIGR